MFFDAEFFDNRLKEANLAEEWLAQVLNEIDRSADPVLTANEWVQILVLSR